MALNSDQNCWEFNKFIYTRCNQRNIKCSRTFVAFGESTMSRTQVQLWYNRFKEAHEDDNAHPGHPSTLTIDENIEH